MPTDEAMCSCNKESREEQKGDRLKGIEKGLTCKMETVAKFVWLNPAPDLPSLSCLNNLSAWSCPLICACQWSRSSVTATTGWEEGMSRAEWGGQCCWPKQHCGSHSGCQLMKANICTFPARCAQGVHVDLLENSKLRQP